MSEGPSRDKSKKRRKSDKLSYDNSLSMPAPDNNIVAGVNAGQDIPTRSIQMPSTSSLEGSDAFPDDLSRHEIRDAIAHGGMSHLELKNKLAADVFMSDEDRHTYMEGLQQPLKTPLEPNNASMPNNKIFSQLSPPPAPKSNWQWESQIKIGNLFEKHGPSPLEQIINKLCKAIAAMFGFSSEKDSKGSLPQHLKH